MANNGTTGRMSERVRLQYVATILRGGEAGIRAAAVYADRVGQEENRPDWTVEMRRDATLPTYGANGQILPLSVLQAKLLASVLKAIAPLLRDRGITLEDIRHTAERGILPALDSQDPEQARLGRLLECLQVEVSWLAVGAHYV